MNLIFFLLCIAAAAALARLKTYLLRLSIRLSQGKSSDSIPIIYIPGRKCKQNLPNH